MLPILALLFAFGAWRYLAQRPGAWTAERAAVYAHLVAVEKDGQKLLAASKSFMTQGFPAEAAALKARAILPTVTGEGRSMRAGLFRQAMRSRRPSGVREMAEALQAQGYGASARQLRGHARGLEVLRELRDRQPGFGIGVVIPSQYVPPPSSYVDPNDAFTAGFGIGTVIPSQYVPPQADAVASPPPPDPDQTLPDPSQGGQ
jgi:hypothetical protein